MDDEPQVSTDGEPLAETPHDGGTKPHRFRRYVTRLGALIVALFAAGVVALLTVDLGPYLRDVAERQGTKFLQRPMHIGGLSAKLTPGVFVLENLVIEGLTPQDRPFLRARRITVVLPWWSAFNRRIVVESIDMTDWDMVVETFPNGRHNFPRFTRDSKGKGPGLFTTTMKSVVASHGQFTYDDHVTPWTTVARNLNVQVYRSLTDYRGRASFSNGTVRIQSYEPFRTDMQSRFKVDGGIVRFDRIDLVGEGSRSVIDGEVDIGHWPEQTYRVRSAIDFATQKDIFFHRENFTASGSGDFTGTFHLFKGGRELKGTFSSPEAGVNAWRFPNLRGSVLWLPDRLDITNATTAVYGGTARFDFRMAPFGDKLHPTRAVWDVDYKDVDLVRLTDFLETQGLRLSGRASGRNRLEWPLGKWTEKRGGGELSVQPAPGMRPMGRELPEGRAAELSAMPDEAGPFNPHLSLGYVPVVGHVAYALDPQWITLGPSWVATERTYVEFEGRTAFGQQSRIPFHVTSLDWLESDRVLAGILTAFGSPTGAVPIGGYGEFDGVMLLAFTRPRIEGKFVGHRMRAWDVNWGDGNATLAIENGYVFIADSAITSGDSRIEADGQFSLGYPRRDNGEEINARVKLTNRPLKDLRHAFELDDYPVDGLVSGEYHLYGKYQTPFGFGRLEIQNGNAYGEPFAEATASLRFEGSGIRLDNLDITKEKKPDGTKGPGRITGAAWVGWDGNYSFNADGTRIPIESLATLSFPRAPLSGVLQFNATGTGTFEEPRYDVKLHVDDLFAGDEGIGQLTGRLTLRGKLLTAELEAASPRLVVSGSGRIALTPEMDAELTLRFAETSLDPYVRFFEPRLSPFTTAVAGGTVRVVGELTDIDHLNVDLTVEQLDMKLFDYALHNDGRIELALDRHVLRIGRLQVAGEGTQLGLDGEVGLHDGAVNVKAFGDANLGILQGFFRDVRSRGTAKLTASITGPLQKPVFSGSATLEDGRLRFISMPHAIEAINGRLSFDAGGVRLDDVKGKLGGGDLQFGGRIGLNGFAPGDLNLTATGHDMRIRYPEGFVSRIDADLALQGTFSALLLKGKVTVHDALWSRRLETSPDIFNLTGSSGGAEAVAGPASQTLPLRFDIDIDAQQSLRIETNIAKMLASADLKLTGTYDRPQLFGRAQIENGDVLFEGNRYIVTRGSVDFFNPTRIEPFFDVEAETRVRLPGETYRVTLAYSGTTTKGAFSLDSDPPLPEIDILGLLFGQTNDLQRAELRALSPQDARQSEEALLRQGMARLLASPLSAPVERAITRTFGIDTFQITPTLGTETDPLAPSARLILGKRLSNRAYLTFTRALGSTQRDQIIVLEYDQNDRLGWVITQTGDRTFALDFRVRHRF